MTKSDTHLLAEQCMRDGNGAKHTKGPLPCVSLASSFGSLARGFPAYHEHMTGRRIHTPWHFPPLAPSTATSHRLTRVYVLSTPFDAPTRRSTETGIRCQAWPYWGGVWTDHAAGGAIAAGGLRSLGWPWYLTTRESEASFDHNHIIHTDGTLEEALGASRAKFWTGMGWSLSSRPARCQAMGWYA